MLTPGIDALLRRIAATPPPFYAGVTELARVPPTERQRVLQDQLAHLPYGRRGFPDAADPIRVGTTGSGDDLLLLAWTAADLACEIEAGARVFGRLGIGPGMRVANALPGALATPGALLLGDVIESIGALDVPLGVLDGPAAAKAAWELLDRVEASVLVLDPASADALFAGMPAGARPWWQGIVWLRSDRLPPRDRPAPPPTFAGWQRGWLAVPDAACFVAHEITPGHFQLDEGVHAEVDAGRLLVTPLASDVALLRYVSAIAVRAFDPTTATIEL